MIRAWMWPTPSRRHRGGRYYKLCNDVDEPLIKGEWLRAGQHIDLIGAYEPDMREADDEALLRARIFGQLRNDLGTYRRDQIPLKNGIIGRGDIVADYYDMAAFKRTSNDEITLFKNGGGAHLDLMTSKFILEMVYRHDLAVDLDCKNCRCLF